MKNDWRNFVLDDDEYEKEYGEEDKEANNPRKLAKDEFEFFANNWFSYLTALAISLTLVAVLIAAFLTVMSFIYNG